MKTIILLLLLAGATGGATFWQTQQQIPMPKEISPPADNWKLPQWAPPQSYLTQTYTRLQKINPWESKGKTTTSRSSRRKKKKSRSNWEFAGIIHKGNASYVLFYEKKTKKISQHALKSTLPDGAQLVKIHEDYVEIQQNGKVEKKYLYKKKKK